MRHAEGRRKTIASTNPEVFFGGDAAWGPKNIIWAVAHGHEAAISIDKFCRGEDVNVRPAPEMVISSQKMGIHEWSYDNEIALDKRYRVPHREKVVKLLRDIKAEVELGYDVELALKEADRCLNCDVQTVFTGQLCIECDACVDICPMDCITFTENGEEADLRARLQAAAKNSSPRTSISATASRPAASWSRTRMCACTAGCAPSAAPPAPGTCRNI